MNVPSSRTTQSQVQVIPTHTAEKIGQVIPRELSERASGEVAPEEDESEAPLVFSADREGVKAAITETISKEECVLNYMLNITTSRGFKQWQVDLKA